MFQPGSVPIILFAFTVVFDQSRLAQGMTPETRTNPASIARSGREAAIRQPSPDDTCQITGIEGAQEIKDMTFKQGGNAGCSFFSALASLQNNPKGARMLSQMVKQQGTSYSVKFPGVGQEITVTQADLEEAKKLTSPKSGKSFLAEGPPPIQAMQVALAKHQLANSTEPKTLQDAFNWQPPELGLGILTGKKVQAIRGRGEVLNNQDVRKIEEQLKQGAHVVATSRKTAGGIMLVHQYDEEGNLVKDDKGEAKFAKLTSNHGYAIAGTMKNKDGLLLYKVVNPHDTSKPLFIPENELPNFVSEAYSVPTKETGAKKDAPTQAPSTNALSKPPSKGTPRAPVLTKRPVADPNKPKR